MNDVVELVVDWCYRDIEGRGVNTVKMDAARL